MKYPFPCFDLIHTFSFGLSKTFLPKIAVKSNKSKNSNLNSIIEYHYICTVSRIWLLEISL